MKMFHFWQTGLCAVVLSLASFSDAAEVSLSGTVYDKDNKPLPGVVVTLSRSGLADTTGADGAWQLRGTTSKVSPHSGGASVASWVGGRLHLNLQRDALIQVDAFDARGSRLGRVTESYLEAGQHELPVSWSRVARSMGWLVLRVNGESQIVPVGGSVSMKSLTSGVLARISADTLEQLVFALQGQLVSSDTVTNLIQSGLTKWIKEFSVSGKLIGDSRVVVDTVFAWFDGGRMTGMRRARMGFNKANLAYSGRIYTVKSITGEVFNYRVWLNVMGNGNKRTGISDTTDFSSDFGAIDFIPTFSVSNAIPSGQIVGPIFGLVDSSFEYSLLLSRTDEVIARYEWDKGDGAGFVPGNAKIFAKWHQPGTYVIRARLIDKDSNPVVLTKTINISSQRPHVLAVRDTVITPGDIAIFSVSVPANGKGSKVIWDFGDGRFDSTFEGLTHSVSYKFLAADSVAPGASRVQTISVKITDGLGQSTVQTAKITVLNDIPRAVVADEIGESESKIKMKVSTVDYGEIKTIEWSVNGSIFSAGGKDTTITLPALGSLNYPVVVRVTDEDGNVSADDTAVVVVARNLTDGRDGKRYRVVTIAGQTWMAQNLNFKTENSYCYNLDSSNCATYGRMYSWAAAMDLNDSCNTKSCLSQISPKHKGLCPIGWHVATKGDWSRLIDTTLDSSSAGRILKANSPLWISSTSGSDDSGFSVLPSGYGDQGGRSFNSLGEYGPFWTATETSAVNAWYLNFYNSPGVNRGSLRKTSLYSLRCIQD